MANSTSALRARDDNITSILNDAEFVMPKVESLQERDEKSLVIAHT